MAFRTENLVVNALTDRPTQENYNQLLRDYPSFAKWVNSWNSDYSKESLLTIFEDNPDALRSYNAFHHNEKEQEKIEKNKSKQSNIDDLNEIHKSHLSEVQQKEAEDLEVSYTDYKVLDLIRKSEILDDTPMKDILNTHNTQFNIMKDTNKYIPFARVHTSTDTYSKEPVRQMDISYIPKLKITELLTDAFLAYEDKVNTINSYFITETDLFDTQVLINKRVELKEGDYLTISFRGTNEYFNFTTKNYGDILTDLYSSIVDLKTYFPFIKESDNLFVHQGFCRALHAIYDKLVYKLQTYDTSIFIDTTGHSLGSMLQSIFIYVYTLDTRIKPKLRYNINFGSPRGFYSSVYNNVYYDVNKYNQRVNLLRIYNTLDLISKLPLASSPDVFDSITRTSTEYDVNTILRENQKTTNFIMDMLRKSANVAFPFKLSGFSHVGFGLELTGTNYIQHHYTEPPISEDDIDKLNDIYDENNPEWQQEKDYYETLDMSHHKEPSYKKNMETVVQLIGLPYHNEVLYKEQINLIPNEIFTNQKEHTIKDENDNNYENVRPNIYKNDNKLYTVNIKENEEYLEPHNQVLGYMIYPNYENHNNKLIMF
jgi:hypothetical protein